MNKRFLFLIGIAFISGLLLDVYFTGNSQKLTASVTGICQTTAESHKLQCAQDQGATCGNLTKVANTSYIYALPNTVLNDSQCFSSELYWTRTVDSIDVTTKRSDLAQNPAINTALYPSSSCANYEPQYICLDSTATSQAYFAVQNGSGNTVKHFVTRANNKYYEYAYDVASSSWLYDSLKKTYFEARAQQRFQIRLPLTQGSLATNGVRNYTYATDTTHDYSQVVNIEYGRILVGGYVERLTISQSSIVRTIVNTVGSSPLLYDVDITFNSGDTASANVWRISNANGSAVSGWIPATVAMDTTSRVQFNADLKISSANNTSTWINDFVAGHSNQFFNVTKASIDTAGPFGTYFDDIITGAFVKNNRPFIVTANPTTSSPRSLYYLLPNSGVLPNLPTCSGAERIVVTNTTNSARTNNFFTGDTGTFTVDGGVFDLTSAVNWSISNPATARISNASSINSQTSKTINFTVQDQTIGSTTLDSTSTLTASTSGNSACSATLSLNFAPGLSVSIDSGSVMVR